MKKAIVALLALLFIVSLVGCSSGTAASDKAVSVGKQAVEAVDGYLDGDATYKETADKLNTLADAINYVYEEDWSEDNMGDVNVATSLVTLSYDLLADKTDQDRSSYNSLIEARNDLAALVGVKKR